MEGGFTKIICIRVSLTNQLFLSSCTHFRVEEAKRNLKRPIDDRSRERDTSSSRYSDADRDRDRDRKRSNTDRSFGAPPPPRFEASIR